MKYANIIVPAIFSALSIFVSYIISSVQLREKNKAFLVFENNGVRNIGNTSALNVSVYRLMPNLGGDGTIVSLITNAGTIEKDTVFFLMKHSQIVIMTSSLFNFLVLTENIISKFIVLQLDEEMPQNRIYQ
ncbi:hypothetical protein [Lactococcus lactis]|uniref:hypothetical protein n=1 Tax=Lactococcus lactis TaxID=1358 RepID=UPI00207C7186|nr:hypothetical protein [Lactococcus lactis]MCO0830824.1 hypothetical protein [Lactococcus lactis]